MCFISFQFRFDVGINTRYTTVCEKCHKITVDDFITFVDKQYIRSNKKNCRKNNSNFFLYNIKNYADTNTGCKHIERILQFPVSLCF